MPITLKELADFCDARIVGGDLSTVIYSAADITSAQAGQVTQLTNSRYAQHIKNSAASACFIAEGFTVDGIPEGMALLVCADPEMSFIKAVELLHPARVYSPQIAPQAVLENNVTLGNEVYIGPYAVIGENTHHRRWQRHTGRRLYREKCKSREKLPDLPLCRYLR